MARCKSPLAFLGNLVKAEVENCDFCALGQDKDPGRKPVFFCLSLGTVPPEEPVDVQGAGDSPTDKQKNTPASRNCARKIWMWASACSILLQNLIESFLKKGKIQWVVYWWLGVLFLFRLPWDKSSFCPGVIFILHFAHFLPHKDTQESKGKSVKDAKSM